MDTDYEREQREQREDERQQAEFDADRRADMAPAPRVLRTPREEVAAYIASAAECLRRNRGRGSDPSAGRGPDVPAALRWLDQAREVVDSPNVVDGAALLRSTVEEARDAAEEGDFGGVIGRLDECLELLRRQVRYPDVEIPVHAGDFEPDPNLKAKRQQVREVISRRTYELGRGPAGLYGGGAVADEVIDELIHAVEAPF